MSLFTSLRLIRSICRARRRGLLYLKKAGAPLALECRGGDCGLCCEILGDGIKVTDQEAQLIPSDGICHSKNSMFLQSRGSVCYFLKNKSCVIYPHRPRGCAEYPWYSIDGELYYDAGCPGIRNDSDQRPKAELIRPFDYYISDFPRAIQKMVIRWVLKR